MTVHDRIYDDGHAHGHLHGPGPHVHWGAVIAGALIAVAIGAMLNLLGAALGAASIDPFRMDGGDAKGLSVAGGIWVALSNAIGLLIGSYIAAKSGEGWSLRGAGLQSLGVWAVAFVVALLIAGLAGTGFVGAAIRGAGDTAANYAATDAMAPAPIGADADVTNNGVVDTPTEVQTAAATKDAADATAGIAGWGFLAMLLGLIASLAGGWLASGRGARAMARMGEHHDHDHHDRETVRATTISGTGSGSAF
ncbi:MAG: hypothetical protein ACXW3D_08955 [Caulobacteraceae bacterium]